MLNRRKYMENTVMVRYGELGLKRGTTRIGFERALIRNMKAGLRSKDIDGTFKKEWGRIFFDTKQVDEACEIISRVFGIVSCSPCWRFGFKKIEEIVDACVKYSKGKLAKENTFAIRASRVATTTSQARMWQKSAGQQSLKSME